MHPKPTTILHGWAEKPQLEQRKQMQALVESGVEGKGSGSRDKYESHTRVGDLTIIFANTRVIMVKRAKVRFSGRDGGVCMTCVSLFLGIDRASRLTNDRRQSQCN